MTGPFCNDFGQARRTPVPTEDNASIDPHSSICVRFTLRGQRWGQVVFGLEFDESGFGMEPTQDRLEKLCHFWGHDDDAPEISRDDVLTLLREVK